MLVRIISVPDGEAPLAIREAWVGLVLPVWFDSGSGPDGSFRTVGVLGGARETYKGFAVPINAAIHALEFMGKTEAADWWKANRLIKTFDWPDLFKDLDCLIFRQQECQVLPKLTLAEVQEHLEKSLFESQHPEVSIDLLLRANHVLDRWLQAHGLSNLNHLEVDSEILKPFWGLISTAYNEALTECQKQGIVDSFNND
jgi:hypothetical protein